VPVGERMRWPNCEADTPEGAKCCIECGIPLQPRSPQCGADRLPRAKLCAERGTPLTVQSPALPAPPQSPLWYIPGHLTENILHSRSALEGEHQQITVLLADFKGSMKLLATRDPDEVRQLLEPMIERMMDAVHPYEGTMN